MPRDERKHQKALMKKRSKQKVASQHKTQQQTMTAFSEQSIIRRAREYPILECRISADWEKEQPGLVQILVARKQPDGDICFGFYLVDKLCLGLKNTLANAGIPPARYRSEIRDKVFRATKSKDCPVELAHQMIYASIEYAEQFGFQPEKDFALNQYILEPRGELEEPYKLTFGRDGKPFFIAGPYDNVARVLRQLEKTAGPGNFDYVAPIGDMDVF
jgi:hypothetical protein